MNFSYAISEDFQNASNAVLAVPMANYLKNNFTFFGIKTEQRRTIFKKNYEEHKININKFLR
jgi:3-methyladenine DNA glycosylase AlkD